MIMAMVGQAPRPDWLDTSWLLAQFGGDAALARMAYFAAALQIKLQGKLAHTEIPRAQRRSAAPPLAQFVAQPERNAAMAQAYATGVLQPEGHCAGIRSALRHSQPRGEW